MGTGRGESWNVRPSSESPRGWTVDYPDVHPDPPPGTSTLAGMSDDLLDDMRPTHFSVAWPAHRVFSTLIDEQVHHGAEIALLRDLYRRRDPER